MAEPRRGDLKSFLIKVGAVTLAALVVLYAAKSWFGGIRRDDGEPKVVSWKEAARHTNELTTVEGQIVLTHRTEKACFLNFHPEWQHTFTAVIFASRFAAASTPSRPSPRSTIAARRSASRASSASTRGSRRSCSSPPIRSR